MSGQEQTQGPALDRERLTNYPRLFLALYVVITAGWWAMGPGLLDAGGKNIGADFLSFYAASGLVLDGSPGLAWDLAATTEAQRAVIGVDLEPYAFHYPPSFLLLCAPLAWLPYLPAFALWCGLGTAVWLGWIRGALRDPMVPGLALAFPGFFQNLVQGQNGLFTASLLAGALWLARSRPLLAGLCLGLLSFKPHLAVVGFVAMLVARRWTVLGAGLGTSGVLAGTSALVLGVDSWTAFGDNAPVALAALETPGVLPWSRMPTVQPAVMLLGLPVEAARAVQGLAGGAALLVLARVWWDTEDRAARALSLVGATLLVTPFGWDYDLAVLALPAVALGRRILDGTAVSGSGRLVAVLWLAPLVLPALAAGTSVQLGPLLWAWMLWEGWRRSDRGEA